ncbi:hypothetical protein M9434_004962 [Picochlorum sp. BPE23]|nr:hypothetical protein M9434_004962 [Picochlorum sp. BPE23]KAI8101108.1 hypothetical protein M9435_001216 [Picochlorum sp. BPE23]
MVAQESCILVYSYAHRSLYFDTKEKKTHRMSAADLGGFSLPGPSLGGFDPFEKEDGKTSKKSDVKESVHIRVQQRNGKKSLTTVQGLPKEFDLKKILKALKKEYCCNGCVVEDEELGKVLQLQGDQRKNVSTFVVENKLVKKDAIKIHGF